MGTFRPPPGLHSPVCGDTKQEQHLRALDASAGRGLPCSWCQEASVAAAALSKGPGEGFSSHQGAEGGLCWFYGGVELVEQYKDTGAQGRIKANGLQLPAFLQRQLGAHQRY